MTTPNGNAPDGSYTLGSRYGQDITEESAKATMRGTKLSGFEQAQTGHAAKWSGFTSISNFLSGLTNAFTGTSSGGGLFSGIFNHAQTQQAAQIVLQNKVEDLLTGGTRSTYMVSGTWTNPGPGKIIGVACIQGGAGGGHSGAPAASGGRYVYTEFKSDDLSSTVAITVGAGGVGAESPTNAAGGVSSFGSYVSATSSGGGILTGQGIILTDSHAGSGGLGYATNSGVATRTTAQMSGTGNALATGAVYTGSNPGVAGTNAPTNQIAVAGGGGGAGSPKVGAAATTRGGAGGWPGGGGGGAGEVGFGGNAIGGNGGVGAVFVTVKG